MEAKELTIREHREQHIMLHGYLDELIADWLDKNKGCYPSESTVLDLMKWSSKQTKRPDHSSTRGEDQ